MVFANATLLLRALLILQGISFIHFYIHQKEMAEMGCLCRNYFSVPFTVDYINNRNY